MSNRTKENGDKKAQDNHDNVDNGLNEQESTIRSPTQESGPVQRIYQSDLVMKRVRKQRDYAYGIVDRIYGDSSDSEDYSDDEEEYESLRPGECDIDWYGKNKNRMDDYVKDSKLEVVDRYLTMGEIVKKVDAPFDQSGIIVDEKLMLDVEQPQTHLKLKNIDSKQAYPEVDFKEDHLVIYDNKWIGRIQFVVHNIMLQFTRNKICILKNIDVDDWDELTDSKVTAILRETTTIPFTSKTKKKYLTEAEWIKGSYEPKKPKIYKRGKIIDIETQHYTLIQVASTTADVEMDEEGYPKFDKEKVKPAFNKYNHLELLAGDSIYLKNSYLETLEDYQPPSDDTWKPPSFNEALSNSRTFFNITCTQRLVSVLWQDGNVEHNVPSTSLFKQRHVDDTDFLPYDIVEFRENDIVKKGMLHSMNSSDRLCTIEWLASGEIQKDFPIYFLKGCESQNFPAGTPVMRFSGSETQWAGMVTNNRGKELTVEWIDGEVSDVYFDEVFIIDEDEVENEVGELQELLEEAQESGNVDDDTLNEIQDLMESEEIQDLMESEVRIRDEERPTIRDTRPEITIEDLARLQPVVEAVEEIQEEESPVVSSTTNAPHNNKDALGNDLFQMVDDLKDHHFKETSTDSQGRFLHRMRREMKILTKSLPPQIYVRWSKTNIQHLRCFMVGQTDTPYLHGFYTFDIELPSDYPHSPPKVHYYSYGEKINPNLYENGNVCLSLLGTWEGRDACECWNPDSSNILQLVISLLGLVLTEKPYFNEAGYDKHRETREGDNNALVYNEQVVAFNMSHLRSTLLNPRDHALPILKSLMPPVKDELQQDIKEYEALVEEGKKYSSLAIMPSPTKHALTYYPTRGFLISFKRFVTEIVNLIQELSDK